jgi:hypothetical protein
MRRLAGAAVIGTRAYQRRVVTIGVALLAIAALLGLTVAALDDRCSRRSTSASQACGSTLFNFSMQSHLTPSFLLTLAFGDNQS